MVNFGGRWGGLTVNVSLLLSLDACILVNLYREFWKDNSFDSDSCFEQTFLQNGPYMEIKVKQSSNFLLGFRAYDVPFNGDCSGELTPKRGPPLYVPFR